MNENCHDQIDVSSESWHIMIDTERTPSWKHHLTLILINWSTTQSDCLGEIVRETSLEVNGLHWTGRKWNTSWGKDRM